MTLNYFERIDLDPQLGIVRIETDQYGSRSLTLPFEGAEGVDLEYGVYVFPVDTWGSLEGSYDYVLTATR